MNQRDENLYKMSLKIVEDKIAFYARQERDAKIGMVFGVIGVVFVIVLSIIVTVS